MELCPIHSFAAHSANRFSISHGMIPRCVESLSKEGKKCFRGVRTREKEKKVARQMIMINGDLYKKAERIGVCGVKGLCSGCKSFRKECDKKCV